MILQPPCGENEIRTRGTNYSVRRFSKPVVSATHPSLRAFRRYGEATKRCANIESFRKNTKKCGENFCFCKQRRKIIRKISVRFSLYKRGAQFGPGFVAVNYEIANGFRTFARYFARKGRQRMDSNEKDILHDLGGREYKYGFTTDIDTELIPKGLNEEVVRLISAKKGEPEWMTERRVAAFRH